MCGIAGFVDPTNPESVSVSGLRRMTDLIKHRGPDSDGFYSQPPLGLGMRRLRIIDLDTGDQPISNETGTIWVVFNGEIYNYAELRAELLQKHHVFKTQSDTEVIVHQYEEDGENCVTKFRGMFTIAIWDATRRRLFLMRDRFGIKPLFVAEQDGKLAFASEMKALFSLPWIKKTWDSLGLRAYLNLGYIPYPLTAYQGIRKFHQGTIEAWEVDASDGAKKILSHQYWTPSPALRNQMPTFGQAVEETSELLKESIRLHLRSDVPLGAFLSGGIDSSSVVALMRLCMSQDIKTFSIGFDDAQYNELPYAELVARHLQTEHYSHQITGAEALELIPVLQGFDEPFADSSAIPTYFVSRLAREHVTVSLSGDGGDELFAGYSQYNRLRNYRLVDWVPQRVRQAVSEIGAQIVPGYGKGGGFIRRLGAPAEYRLLSLTSTHAEGYLVRALSIAFTDFLDDAMPDISWQKNYLCGNSVIEAQIADQKTYLADDILVKVDRCSMAVSLEARVPLLDHHFSDYINGLPTSYKLQNGTSKRLLKQIVTPYLPPDILNRPKRGFVIPLRTWLLGPLKQYTQELLLDDPRGLFNPSVTAKFLEALKNGGRNASGAVWKLLSLSVWANGQGNSKPF